MRRMPRPHGQLAKGFGRKRIGRDEKPGQARPAMRHDRDDEEQARPLGAAGDATPHEQAPQAVIGRDAVGLEGKRRGLPALMGQRRKGEGTEGSRGEREASHVAATRHDDAPNRERREQRESEKTRPNCNRARQRYALRHALRPGTFGSARQATQMRLKTSVPFVPPNPNEFFSATSIFISRAVLAQ